MWQSSRRPLVGIFMAMLWGAYYFLWRGSSMQKISFKTLAISAVPILFVAAFSTTRWISGVGATSVSDHLDNMQQADVEAGLLGLVSGQDTGSVSFWLIENYPERMPYKYFNTFKVCVSYAVPRELWPDKPVAMSMLYPEIAGQENVPYGIFNVGPGVIGHGASEGGIISTVLYAIWIAVFLRFIDAIILTQGSKPFAIGITCSGLGHILAIARGESGSFIAITTICFIAAWAASWVLAGVSASLGLAQASPAAYRSG